MIENAAISGTDNKIINGNFAVNQRAAAFTAAYTAATPIVNNDDTYHFDRWYTLSDGNDIVDIHSWGRTTGSRSFATGGNDGRGRWLPLDAGFAMSTAVETADKKFGIAQIIESANCNDLRGQKCTLSFKARLSGTLTATIKAAVVGWFGTPDTVTSDIISAWNGNGVTPTLIASAEYQNDPSAITTLNNKFQTHKIVTSISESITNIIVFIWSDSTSTTVDDQFYITNVQLERGEFENPKFQNEDYGTTLRKCQRYYWQTGRSSAQYTVVGNGVGAGDTAGYIHIPHPPMRAAGTVAENGDTTLYDSANSAVTSLATTIATVEGTWMYLGASGGGVTPLPFHAEIISLVTVSGVPNQPTTAAFIVAVSVPDSLALKDNVHFCPRKSLQFADSMICAMPNFLSAVSTAVDIAKPASSGSHRPRPSFPPVAKLLLPVVLPHE
jgi:hypothetical protein